MPQTASGMKIVVCGLARDCRKNLLRNWKALQKIMSHYDSCEWVIVENDSVDGTKEWLEEKSRIDPKFHVIGEPTGVGSMPRQASGKVRPWFSHARIGKMAFFRNQYLAFISNHIGFANVDAVLVVDFDVHRLPVSRIRHWLDHFDGHTAVTAFGIYWRSFFTKGFYDSYAHLELDTTGPQTEKEVLDGRRDLYLKYRNRKNPVEVLSNFSGCALYPSHLLEGLSYESLPNPDPHLESFCEHVSVHRGIHEKGGRILLDPEMKVIYSTALLDWKRYLGNRLKGL